MIVPRLRPAIVADARGLHYREASIDKAGAIRCEGRLCYSMPVHTSSEE